MLLRKACSRFSSSPILYPILCLTFAVQLEAVLQVSNGSGSPSMHGQEGDQALCTPARGLQFRMCDRMVALQADEQVLLTASAMGRLALKLCCVCGLLERLCPCHGAIEGAQHVCRPAGLQPKLPCLQKQVEVVQAKVAVCCVCVMASAHAQQLARVSVW